MISARVLFSKLKHCSIMLLQALLCLTVLAPQAPAQTSKLNQMQARDLVNKGNALLSRRLFQEALDEYQKAIDLDPSNAAARNNIVLTHLNWGAVYFGMNKFEEATQEWETVLRLDPYNQNAKHNLNVLKQTVARRGASQPAKPPAPPPEKPKEEKKPESSIVILTPGLKQSQGSTSASVADSEDSSSSAPAATPPAESASPAAPASGDTSAPANSGAAPGAFPPPQATPAGASLEDQLTAIELKIYGHKQFDMTVLKRLEKMEVDTAGQPRPGTIKERIDFLKKSYGLP